MIYPSIHDQAHHSAETVDHIIVTTMSSIREVSIREPKEDIVKSIDLDHRNRPNRKSLMIGEAENSGFNNTQLNHISRRKTVNKCKRKGGSLQKVL